MVGLELLKQLYSLHVTNPSYVKTTRHARGVWSGDVPARSYANPKFSLKIFVGGVPWDIDETTLLDAFRPYGMCHVEWPNRMFRPTKNLRGAVNNVGAHGKSTGYVYVVFQNEISISFLLTDCIQSCHATPGELYFCMQTGPCERDFRQVQIIPWVISDSVYWSSYLDGSRHDSESSNTTTNGVDKSNTVFVGALHGLITAPTLASIMEETYGGTVLHVTINTDKYNYPIGSGRVTFAENWSYRRAIESEFLEIRTSKFVKKIQIDPFVEDPACKMCKCRGCHNKERAGNLALVA